MVGRVAVLLGLLWWTASVLLAAPIQPETGDIQLDGAPLSGLRYVTIKGEAYFPLQDISDARHLGVTVSADGTITRGRLSFKSAVVEQDGKLLVARADVKRALEATIYVDSE